MKLNTKTQELLTYLQRNGPSASGDVVKQFGISRATLMRRVRELGDRVVTLGKARATLLAARRDLRTDTPLYQVLENAQLQLAGHLIPLQDGERTQWLLRPEESPAACFEGEFKNGLYPDWPWFLEDLRPSGFLGRAFGKRMAKLFSIDTNPENWNGRELLMTLTRFGSNLPGNFILGDGMALNDFQEEKLKIAKGYYRNNLPQIYPELAKHAMDENEDFGSSAGGDQPKFTTMVSDAPGETPRSVIVKFSPHLESPLGQRWSDLLHAEHLANQILTKAGFATAKTRIFQIDRRTYLESERFDRIVPTGRRGLVTLRSLDAAYLGLGIGTWADCARKLVEKKWIRGEDYERIAQLHCFGELIANTDMHWGNLSFFFPGQSPYPLAPVYDMLPMRFRPSSTGEVRQTRFDPKLPKPEDQTAWLEMYPHAHDFWKEVSAHPDISEDFKAIAEAATDSLETVYRVAIQ
ncbi:type II toxin-antitoxin system HipA family toxin YjjJ [Coraliomargarita sinensis]|nr:type II toxin-antitoxin system HipA family toxin YjjJ [Coraliomargarita sinensis]